MTTNKPARNRFSRLNQPVKCRGCGKTTTTRVQGVVGLDLCAPCQDSAGLENEHGDNDGQHFGCEATGGKHPDCPDCQAEARARASAEAAAALTDDQIRALRAAALELGDYALVNVCDMALVDHANSALARRHCAKVWASAPVKAGA